MSKIPSSLGVAFAAVFTITAIRLASAPASVQPLLSEQTAPNPVFAVADTSKSNRWALPSTASGIASLSLALDPATTWLTILRSDSTCEEVSSAPLAGSDEEAAEHLIPKLQPTAARDNTYMNLPLTVIAARAAAINGRCVVIIFSDFFCEGMTSERHRQVLEAATSLAANTHVLAVLTVGVDPKQMAVMRADLAPLGTKLYPVTGAFDPELVASIFAAGGVK